MHPSLSLCDLTQGRLHETRPQPGHLYFHLFSPHSSHRTGFLDSRLGLGFDGDWKSAMLERRGGGGDQTIKSENCGELELATRRV